MIPKKIVIFGSSGTGKSSTGKILAQKLGYSFNSSGNLMRKKAKELGISIYDFDGLCKKESKYDLELDQKVKEFGENNEHFIFESRLAWYFIPDAFKIYFECDEDLTYLRISKRENISFEKAKELTLKRNLAIIERYSILYPNLVYPPKKDLFDLVIDTTDDLIEDTVFKILELLKKIK